MAKKTLYISGKEMLTAHGLADYFGVSLSTIQNWERQGKMQLERDTTDSARGTRFILPDELEKLKKIEHIRENKYVNTKSEKNRLITFLAAMNINTVEDFIAAYMTPTQPVQPHRFYDTMSDVPTMLLKDEEPQNVLEKLKAEVEPAWKEPKAEDPEDAVANNDPERIVLWSSGGMTDERLPITAETRDEMFGAWIADNVNQPEVKSRDDINIDNGKEAVKGCQFLLWTKEK